MAIRAMRANQLRQWASKSRPCPFARNVQAADCANAGPTLVIIVLCRYYIATQYVHSIRIPKRQNCFDSRPALLSARSEAAADGNVAMAALRCIYAHSCASRSVIARSDITIVVSKFDKFLAGLATRARVDIISTIQSPKLLTNASADDRVRHPVCWRFRHPPTSMRSVVHHRSTAAHLRRRFRMR